MSLTRRDFLKCVPAAAIPLAMPRLSFGATGAARDVLVIVFQRGGRELFDLYELRFQVLIHTGKAARHKD